MQKDIDAIVKRVQATTEKVDAFIEDQQGIIPSGSTVAASGLDTNTELPLHVAHLLCPPDTGDFIRRAYLALLGRPADKKGLTAYQQGITESGMSRLNVLFEIYFSGEGRKLNKPVQGWLLDRKIYSSFLRLSALPLLKGRIAAGILNKAKQLILQFREWQLGRRYSFELLYLQQIHLDKMDQRLASQQDSLLEYSYEIDRLTSRNESAIKEVKTQLGVVRQDTLYQLQSWSSLLKDMQSHSAQTTNQPADESVISNNPVQHSTPTVSRGAPQVLLDAYYTAFEDANRGSTDEIRAKLNAYLPYISDKQEVSVEKPVLDIGSGRGEWLSMLKEQGVNAYGLDINAVMVAYVNDLGMKAVHEDAVEHLSGLASNSLSIISGFHIIEHVPFPELFEIFKEANRVLIPGGLIIFETPNPENVLVGSHTFYHDFTHRNPVTPSAVSFLAQYHNFQSLEILRLNPYPEDHRVPGNDPLTERVNGHLCGPQDYALIARKPDLPESSGV